MGSKQLGFGNYEQVIAKKRSKRQKFSVDRKLPKKEVIASTADVLNASRR